MTWRRTAAEANLYGYFAHAWAAGGGWEWRVYRGGLALQAKPLAKGKTMREMNARAAARRWVLAQPDAKAAHEAATRCHWNGRAFDGASHAASSNRGDLGPSFINSACGVDGGWSTNEPHDRNKIDCAKCLELLAASESAKAVAP